MIAATCRPLSHLHLNLTDDPDRPADARIILGVPSVGELSMICIEESSVAMFVIARDHSATYTLRLGEPSVRVLPIVTLRLLAVTQRRSRWAKLEVSAPSALPIWRARLYPQVLAEHMARLAA
ncbi:MAG: hypothetical protein JSR48_00750 [Verrucomicrobia bacterium]|nr:hypothetical protein [Verrucomicrobiota bacterium]